MGDEIKLERLKRDFLVDLKIQSSKLCYAHKKDYMKCLSESMFNRCEKFMKEFEDCAKRTFEELKEENKELFGFKINPDS